MSTVVESGGVERNLPNNLSWNVAAKDRLARGLRERSGVQMTFDSNQMRLFFSHGALADAMMAEPMVFRLERVEANCFLMSLEVEGGPEAGELILPREVNDLVEEYQERGFAYALVERQRVGKLVSPPLAEAVMDGGVVEIGRIKDGRIGVSVRRVGLVEEYQSLYLAAKRVLENPRVVEMEWEGRKFDRQDIQEQIVPELLLRWEQMTRGQQQCLPEKYSPELFFQTPHEVV